MAATDVATCFLRNEGEYLLRERSDDADSSPSRWDAVTSHVASVAVGGGGLSDEMPDDGGSSPETVTAARDAIRALVGIDPSATALARAGEPFVTDQFVVDADKSGQWRVYPFLFASDTRAVETDATSATVEWVSPTEILRRDGVPGLWTAYDRVRPRVATVAEDRAHGSAALSVRALEVLRDEAALANAGRSDDRERREAEGDDWAALAALARRLLAARPSMAVVANRVNRAMHAASETGTPAALERGALAGIERAFDADSGAAATAADRLPARVATLSRSGTVLQAIHGGAPESVLVTESRPGREGVPVAEELADSSDVTLTSDAAFPAELDAWGADALLVGADRVRPDGSVVNKVGTRASALAAAHVGVPCYVVAASDKIATDDAVDREERDPSELYDGDAPLSVANPTFDVTPAAAVDALLTERGPLDPSDVAAIAAEHRRLADWE